MEFYSSGYPGKYQNGISCVMYLQAFKLSAPQDFFIDLYFADTFAIEESEELRDGPFGFSDFIARFCGNEFPVTVQTKSRFLWARFTSDNLMESDGFRASIFDVKTNCRATGRSQPASFSVYLTVGFRKNPYSRHDIRSSNRKTRSMEKVRGILDR
ncbi:hypothetical protein DPMN_178525 [Dreissena polymorpha]|uniref:CUB domain-containing protein n=1 Tax=Dreissena polymorpha TaxID=45954 RepID=A0A9D4ED22_DREPO|nr:hypothetical protein DPMN_178525 [Dreissena polymorpha]